MIYEIVYKGKVLERLATKEVAEKIAEMYRRGEVWTLPKALSDVKVIERVSISSLAEKAKEEERLNREKMMSNYNASLDKIQPYENKHFLNLVDEIFKELN